MDTEENDVILEQDGEEVVGTSEEELEATESRADTKVLKIKKELEDCKKEKAEYLDGWQRAKADYANALKRFEQDRMAAIGIGQLKASRAFLPAIDSLARAESAGEIPESFKGIAKQLHDATTSLGLEQFGAIGDVFDPVWHEALGQDDAKGPEDDDTITAVLEQGWKSGINVVRPAKVRVAHFEVG